MIYYIGYYNCDAIRDEQRIVAPAAENKMRYVITALSQAIGEPFEVVSPAQTKAYRFFKGKKQEISEGVCLKTFPTFNSKLKLFRVFGHLMTKWAFTRYLMKRVNPEDHLIVYHSLAYRKEIKHIQKRKACKLTIEVEEIYADVKGDVVKRAEEIDFLQTADSYLFITELLRQTVNTEKPSILSNGTYKALPDYGFRFKDDKIHVVYAGTFRKAKGGAYTAIEVAEFLDDGYVLEVLGNGNDEEIAAIRQLIYDVSQKTDCEIKYVGFKSGKDFDSYIQACHIGLSTQPPDAKFNATSFPSKVLMYMSNGLRVVSVNIPAIETSAVGDWVYYYAHQEAKEIADVIKSVAFDDGYDSRARLDQLDTNFVEQLKKLLIG